jgi:hypothetical protein
MSHLKPGWPAKVQSYLLRQTEPVTVKKLAAEALGLEACTLKPGEYKAVAGAIYNTGWRSTLFWCPPAIEGDWTAEAEAA